NLKLDLGGGGVRTAKMYPADLPDLFKGDQLVVAGRYSGAGEVEAKLTGNVGGREQTFSYKLHFDDRKATDSFGKVGIGYDYVPRLWATRRVGFLLDEIRIHGETAELRDETTELARKYGIVTPYTAYLIVEDEDRRRVPMADRSMQSMSADAATRAEVAKAWTGFKDKKEGEDGVANARSQNAFKFAQQAPAPITSGTSESLRGFAAAVPAGTPAAARLSQYTQQSRFINGRAFFQNGNQWIDSNAQNNTAKRQRIQFNSEEYFNLLKKYPEAGPWLALGQNVMLALDDTVYEIADNNPMKTLTTHRIGIVPLILSASAILGFWQPLFAKTAPTPQSKPRIEVCFVLDTTGSMGGLIEGAKQKIWSIANEMIGAQPTP